MKLNRNSMNQAIVGIGLVGVLIAGGVVAAQAATGDGPIPQPGSTSVPIVGDCQVGHRSGMEFGRGATMTAVSDYLGLSRTDLREQLWSGKSLADVAKDQGKSISGLEDAIVAALKTTLDADSAMTPDQKAAAVEQMRTRIDAMVNADHTSGEGMGMGIGMGMGMDYSR